MLTQLSNIVFYSVGRVAKIKNRLGYLDRTAMSLGYYVL
uniref:Uncharacterized protein n=1 Tax=Anguilla anguilla TaxID=7936 RepID=A0A0E9RH96_ANGAN